MQSCKNIEQGITNSEMEVWFDDVIAQIKTDKFLLQTDTATKEKVELYNDLYLNNTDKILDRMNVDYRMNYITKIVLEYIEELADRLRDSLSDIKIAFDFSNNKLLVWAVIPVKNEEFYEKCLVLAEAKINAKFFDKGFCISSTIVSEEDNLSIPEQYKQLSN